MSLQSDVRRLTAPDILARKNGEPIVALNSYLDNSSRLVYKYF
jgi:3-methyl-2-oxobutanoate hydroxymethyltransferase